MVSGSAVTVGTVVATGVTAVCAALWLWRRSRRNRKVGHVGQLIIYPVKSCRGVSVQKAQCSPLGLQHGLLRDRAFMIVNEKGTFINLVGNPTAVLIAPSLQENGTAIWMDAPGMETLKLTKEKLENLKGPIVHVNYKGLDMMGYDCGDTCAEWFQQFLKRPHLRLVYFGDGLTPIMGCTKEVLGHLMKENDMSIYNFTSNLLVLSEESVADLNTRIKEPIPVTNFRANIMVRGCKPYDEDNWATVNVGPEVKIQTRKLCQRCPYVDINGETGVRNPEILKTLKTYRQSWDQNLNKLLGMTAPIMGLNMGLEQTGEVCVGDPVIVSYK